MLRATPPKIPLVGEGLTNAFGSKDSLSILVLSPRIEPPDLSDDGSIANTASFFFSSCVIKSPNFSIKLDFPAPGAPHIPILIPLFRLSGVYSNNDLIILSA